MMHGFVNQRCEAILRIAVGHADAPKQSVEAVIDTGFTGFLSLPPSTITNLGISVILELYNMSIEKYKETNFENYLNLILSIVERI
nr:hypothetical protein [Acaryochloris sp. CCMEE 5410]